MVSLKMVTVVYNIVQILLVAYIILPLLMTNLNVVYKESFVLIKLATYSPAGCGWTKPGLLNDLLWTAPTS
jgi:hypothetical protein